MKLREILAEGRIGEVKTINASFGFPCSGVERLLNKGMFLETRLLYFKMKFERVWIHTNQFGDSFKKVKEIFVVRGFKMNTSLFLL